MRPLIFTLALASIPAHGETTLDINGWSRHSAATYTHLGDTRKYNSQNLGLGVTWSASRIFELSAGWYNNSYYQTSVYASARIKYDWNISKLIISPGVGIGIVTGYDSTPARAYAIQPLALPNLRVSYCGYGVTLGYIPGNVSVLTLQGNYSIN
jgi:hypothetical protein